MSGLTRLTLAAWAASLMAAGALLPLVKPATWIFTAAFLLALQSAAGMLCRRVPLARPLTIGAQLLVSVIALTAVFAREQALLGFLPGPLAVQRVAELFRLGAEDVGTYAIPAPDTEGIRLMLVAGVLAIGLLVDVLAVTFRRAAPAGLPLLALYSVAAGLSGGGAGRLWFLLAATGYLLLLLAEGRDRLSAWGRVFGGAQRSGRPGSAAGGGGSAFAPVRTGRRIGAVAMGTALVVPLVLPGFSGGLLGTGGGAGPGEGGGGGGTIAAVNPLVSLQDNLRQPEDFEVLRYRTNAVDNSGLYLRLVALDQFDGTSWKSSVRPIDAVPKVLPWPDGLAQSVRTSEVTSNFVASEGYDQKWLPMPFPAARVDIEGRWRFEPAGRMLVGDDKQTTKGVRYQVTSLDVQPTSEQLAQAGPAPEQLLREYTKVPGSLPADVRSTALEITKDAANDYERAVRLQDWFAEDGGFRYDVDVTSGTGTEAISRFLKDKEGFCIHFSFSMAAMARTLGIPARVAVGFMPGTTQSDGSVSVGIRDAHAWPELYFEGAGWTRFEPTPSRGSTPAYTRQVSPTGGPTGPAQPSATSSAQPSAAPSASESCPPEMRRLGECGPNPAAADDTSSGGGTDLLKAAGWTLAALLVLALPLIPFLWRTRVRAKRLAPSGGALAVWREIGDTAWDHGLEPDEAQTPRRTAERIVRAGELSGEAAEAVHRVARAVEETLYAPAPRAVAGLAEDAKRVRAGFRAHASRAVRLRALLAPRSAARLHWSASAHWTTLKSRTPGLHT
ncbi:transglutaminaseTgpA domain-containing protein [Streptomyces hydrogenans]|uniref:Transglutaminase n=1 Tax=Streptomyces hydrogenans TaxID=1873719 RepID=A0ABQ3P949_9ACTN|nr:transglutaminaseTgpA domain-containing protein [Streptomyces hydrogenans]GHG11298.1 transglutaminase [Streptomyces hydrogenans]GHI21547.1 transglutaminase [Streptomyces hydrogenans]